MFKSDFLGIPYIDTPSNGANPEYTLGSR
jgi:hypothetical protein